MQRLYSTIEVCKLFSISPATLKRRLKAGDFPPPRKLYPNGDNRWTESDLTNVISAMPIAEAYRDSKYFEKQAHCA